MMNNQHPGIDARIVARIITTPDGQAQIISLVEGWWNCLDWMIVEKGESVKKIAEICWHYSHKYPTQPFATIFNYYLHCYMMDHRANYFGLANDNYNDKGFPWEGNPFSFRSRLKRRFLHFVPDETTG